MARGKTPDAEKRAKKPAEDRLSAGRREQNPVPGSPTLEAEINTSLNDVMDLLAQEVERLKVALEFYRLSEHPHKDRLVRWHVQQIDARQDRLEEIKALILAQGDESEH